MANGKETIKVLSVDDAEDHNILMDWLMRDEPDLELVGTMESADGVVEAVQRWRPDIVLMDLLMPGLAPVEAIRALSLTTPFCRVIVHSSLDDSIEQQAAIEAGAWGSVSKNAESSEVFAAIRRAANED